MGNIPYLEAYASVAFAMYCIAEIIVGSIYFQSCYNWLPIGIYLIVFGSIIIIFGICQQLIPYQDKYLKIFGCIYSIFYITLMVLGYITVWSYNSECTPSSYYKFAQASTIINLLPLLITISLHSN